MQTKKTPAFVDRDYVLKIALDAYPYKTVFNEDEFKKDFFRFYVVRKMARRFSLTGIVSDKLLINNIIICLNIFGIKSSNIIWKVICNDNEFSVVKSCLLFLNSLNPKDTVVQHNKKMMEILNEIKQK